MRCPTLWRRKSTAPPQTQIPLNNAMKKVLLIVSAIAASSALAIALNSSTDTAETAAPKAAPATKGCCMAGTMSAPTAADPAKPKSKPYPLDVCIVSDEKLGSMGDPVVFDHKGQEIKLCCKACRKKFDKDPATFLKKLEPKK